MIRTAVGLALVIACLTLTSCKLELFDHTAAKIAEIRLAGNPSTAKLRALEVLQKTPGKLDVWRELAATDLDLCKRAEEAKKDPLPNLVEAALICGALNVHEKSKLDHEWTAVGMEVAVEAERIADKITQRLEPRPVTERFQTEEEILPGETERDLFKRWIEHMSVVNSNFYDPDVVGVVVKQTSLLMELLGSLPFDDPKMVAVTLNTLEQKMKVTTMDSNIDLGYVTSRRAAAKTVVDEALHSATDDLETLGHLQIETIQQNHILE